MTGRMHNEVFHRAAMTLAAIVVSVNIFAVPGFAGVSRADFPLRRTMSLTPGSGAAELGVLRLDTVLLPLLDATLANMRIFDSTGSEIPFVITTATVPGDSVEEETEADLKPTGFKDLGNDRIAMLFERSNGTAVPHRLCIQTAASDFEKRITVLGKRSNGTWDTLASGRTIYAQSRYLNLRNTCVDFAAKNYTTYRLEIDQFTERESSAVRQIEKIVTRSGRAEQRESYSEKTVAFTIDAVRFYATVRTPRNDKPVVADYPLHFAPRRSDMERQTSIFSITSAREPLTSLAFSFVDRSFIRSALLDATDDAGDSATWIELCRSTLHTIAIGAARDSSLQLDLSGERRFRRYRLTIEDGDSPPLTLVSATGRGRIYEARFLTHGLDNAFLFFGAESIPAARYDLASVLERSGKLTSAQWEAGPSRPNPGFRTIAAGKPAEAETATPRILFLAAVLLMVVVLALLLVRVVRKMEKQ
jgi:hypothetical protein